MGYLYPHDLIKEIKGRWNTKFWAGEKVPNLPKDELLTTILDVAYIASLMTEEARRIRFQLVYISPEEAQKSTQISNKPIRFCPPRPFTASEVLRIAPAGDPTMTMLAIFESEKLGIRCDTALAIWGLIDIGSEYWKCIRGEVPAALSPPNCFTVAVIEPGHIVISRLGNVFLRLKQGRISGESIDIFSSGPINGYLSAASKALYQDATKRLKLEKYSEEADENDYAFGKYFDFLENILLKTQEKRHGGTFIIIPDALNAEDSRLKDRIRIKYVCEGVSSWNILVKELCSHKQYFGLEEQLRKKKNLSVEKYQQLETFRYSLESAQQDLADKASLYASLTSVDGVVLLTDRYRLIGFGGEVIATSSVEIAEICYDSDGNKRRTQTIDNFGMRHRSALRFCSSYEDSIAFVISQDGQVRAVKRCGSQVLIWDDVAIGK